MEREYKITLNKVRIIRKYYSYPYAKKLEN